MKKLTLNAPKVKHNQIEPYLSVGIDTHKNSNRIAIWGGSAIVAEGDIPADNKAILDALEPYKELIKGIVYEAGPTGFGLARALAKNGYPVKVAVPTLIPREPSKTNKTDRLDAAKLARFLGIGAITKFVTIPDEDEEDKRCLVRLIEQFKTDKCVAKNRIKSFLLFEGAKYNDSWSRTSRQKMLESVRGEQAKYALARLFESLEYCEGLITDVRKRIRETVKADEDLSERVKILRSHPGVGEETAAAFAFEMFPGRKFKNGNQVGAFLGLAPHVQSSGETEIRGSIIKKGRAELRRLLVQCAWIWVRVDRAGNKKFLSLCEKTGSARKAIVAMARRLGIHLWKMLETGTCYNAKLYAHAIRTN